MAEVCPSGEKNIESNKKNRTPDAERKYRRRHGLPPLRRRGERGAGKTLRADRQEACRAVAIALLREPGANVARLAALAWPDFSDEKSPKAARERARRAIADLKRDPRLAGDTELTEKVKTAFAARAEAEAARREERARKERERAERRCEREARFHAQLARKMMRRLLQWMEIKEEISMQIRAKRQDPAGQEDVAEREFTWATPLGPMDVLPPLPVPHACPGLANFAVTAGAGWRADVELRFIRLTASLATITASAAWDILAAAKALRRARRRGDAAKEARAEEALRRAVAEALAGAGWADPDLAAGQALESPAARAAREEAARQGAAAWAEAAAAQLEEKKAKQAAVDQFQAGRGAGPEAAEEERDEAAEIAEEACGYAVAAAATAAQAWDAVRGGLPGGNELN